MKLKLRGAIWEITFLEKICESDFFFKFENLKKLSSENRKSD